MNRRKEEALSQLLPPIAGLAAICTAVTIGAPAFAAGVLGNAAWDAIKWTCTSARRRYLAAIADPQDDLAQALNRAAAKALDEAICAFKDHPERWRSVEKDQFLIEALHKEARAARKQGHAHPLMAALDRDEVAIHLDSNPDAALDEARRELVERTTAGYPESFRQFLFDRLTQTIPLHFLEELKNPDAPGTRAWRQYQRVQFEALREGVESMRSDLEQDRETWARILQSLAEMTGKLEILDSLNQRIPNEPFADILDARIEALTKQVRGEGQKTRDHISVEHEKTREGIHEDIARLHGPSCGLDFDAYAKALLSHCTNLGIDSLHGGVEYQSVKLWDVFVPQTVRESTEYLPRLHEIPKAHLRQLRERGEIDEDADSQEVEVVEEVRRRYMESIPRSVLEVLEDPNSNRLVILGDPGAGKSAFMRYVASTWARLSVPERSRKPVPLFIELREFARWKAANSKTFCQYLQHGNPVFRLDSCDLHKWLKDGGEAVLLLDGLDEIFDLNERDYAVGEAKRFALEYDSIPIVVTRRIVGFKGEPFRSADFRIHVLQDFEDDEIDRFISTWHRTKFEDEKDARKKEDRLRRSLEDSERIRELAGNPLLLTMMAVLNRRQQLPRDRAELYEQCARVLLDLWDTERLGEVYPELKQCGIDFKDKVALLGRVAWVMQTAPEGEAGNAIPEERLLAIFEDYLRTDRGLPNPRPVANSLIEQLRLRNFTLCFTGGGLYSFVHRTFQEYYCAKQIVERFEARQLSEEEVLKEVYVHWNDERWSEVLCLIGGMLKGDAPGRIVDYLLARPEAGDYHFRHIFLAARVLLEVRNPARLGEQRSAALAAVEPLMKFDFPFVYRDWEEKDLLRQRSEVISKAVQLAAELKAQTDRNQAARWLKDRARNDEDWRVRSTCVKALTRGWKEDPETLPWLKDRARNDEDEDVRRACVEALARGWREDPETLPLLKDLARKDEDGIVRSAYVEALARGWKGDPETLPLLKDLARNDEDRRVRSTCVEALARGWKEDPETLPLLKYLARNDQHWLVRRACVDALARGWKEDPETLPLLKYLARNDQHWQVRRACVDALVRCWRQDPDVQAVLQEIGRKRP